MPYITSLPQGEMVTFELLFTHNDCVTIKIGKSVKSIKNLSLNTVEETKKNQNILKSQDLICVVRVEKLQFSRHHITGGVGKCSTGRWQTVSSFFYQFVCCDRLGESSSEKNCCW